MAARFSFCVLLVTSLLCLVTAFAGEDPAQKKIGDDQRIQGTWAIIGMEQVNHTPTKEELDALKEGSLKVTITATTIIFAVDKSEMKYRLDSSKHPKVLETLSNGKVTARSIYELKGDDLKICMGRVAERGEPEPPDGFDIKKRKPGTFPTLFVLRRDTEKPDDAR